MPRFAYLNIGHCVELTFLEGKLGRYTAGFCLTKSVNSRFFKTLNESGVRYVFHSKFNDHVVKYFNKIWKQD